MDALTSANAEKDAHERPEAPAIAVLVGSPRHGRSLQVARILAEGIEAAGCRANVVHLAQYHVAGCIGCGACNLTGACILPDAQAEGLPNPIPALMAADGLALVSPVYFAGPPSQLKALFDRMQPLWAQRYLLKERPLLEMDRRKPLDILAVGAGGDPFGFDALVTCARSALRMADFELDVLRDLTGEHADAPRDLLLEWGADLALRALAKTIEKG